MTDSSAVSVRPSPAGRPSTGFLIHALVSNENEDDDDNVNKGLLALCNRLAREKWTLNGMSFLGSLVLSKHSCR
ncbi:hypothetical protein Ac2012v2_006797 [Leucoagaricus gongylophorus]